VRVYTSPGEVKKAARYAAKAHMTHAVLNSVCKSFQLPPNLVYGRVFLYSSSTCIELFS
jgi:hypothetical protein